MLSPRDLTHSCEVLLENVVVDKRTPPNAHAAFQQVYIILAGEGDITIGNEVRHVVAPAVAFIPKNTHHQVVNTGHVEFEYLYVTVWDDTIPNAEFEGGWQKIYAEMKQEYSDRGYPAE